MSKFNDATRDVIADEFFSGVSAAKLAKKYKCHHLDQALTKKNSKKMNKDLLPIQLKLVL